ncbi:MULTISPECIES: hypothetical protein [unclassified Variovorax]|uniref:hypothetical protein n=1 Tax=unclassified Variovorax TaxID=663243 RepID=UPI00076D8BE9|nr:MULTISPECIES: hypothetical protein [unclassified Variovorax]KWT98464.1 hypothetical protein APY03_0599 [Variovorax sp. WDL1]PNG49863.1 hypothetical protein CHC06_05444 [Variovorax sp. B2]PNG50735.1 hypothetical protein CHC07_05349 [Variovorax sp. B4]VTU42276.1 hypothetical protein H6P1_00145 [Variovorax sp. PBL-H6]VTU44106.1 hypothetical protein SRS16P1_00757 [Variovorax sp. SRS16]
MSGEFSYRLRNDLYELYQGEKLLGQPMLAVSLALDEVSGAVLQHGSPELVEPWGMDRRAKLRADKNSAEAERLVVLTGRIPVVELNRCFTQPGHAAEVLARARAGTLEPEPTNS